MEDPEAKQKLFLEAALGPLDGPPEAFAPAGNRNTGGAVKQDREEAACGKKDVR